MTMMTITTKTAAAATEAEVAIGDDGDKSLCVICNPYAKTRDTHNANE